MSDVTENVKELLEGVTPGSTLWALRAQVKRDVENGTDQEKLVPYGIVLAYAEQAVEEAVTPLKDRIAEFTFKFICVSAFAFTVGVALGLAL